MSENRCIVCGRVAPEGFEFCSSGCSLAARLPLGEEALPVSKHLSFLLAAFFVWFNQALFLSIIPLKQGDGSPGMIQGFLWVSMVCGVLFSVISLLVWSSCRPLKISDFLVLFTVLALWIIYPFLDFGDLTFAGVLFVANTLIFIWLGRGYMRLRSVLKKRKK